MRRGVFALAAVLSLAGCGLKELSPWRSRDLYYLGKAPPELLRVTTADGVRQELYWPVFTDSTVSGWPERDTTAQEGTRITVATARVSKAEVYDKSYVDSQVAACGILGCSPLADPGCETYWYVDDRSLAEILPAEENAPAQLRFTRANGTAVVLDRPFIRDDKLLGQDADDGRDRRPFTIIPIDDVVRVEQFGCPPGPPVP